MAVTFALDPKRISEWEDVFLNPSYRKAQTQNILAQAELQPFKANYYNALTQAALTRSRLLPERIAEMRRRDDIREKIEEERERLADIRSNLMQQRYNYLRNRIDITARMQGIPYSVVGKKGLYQKPTAATQSGLQKVIDAFNPLNTAMKQIQKGALYYINAPNELKRYDAALVAYLTGNPSEKDNKILSQAGISLNAIREAAETASRIMNIPRTNEGFRSLFGLFQPTRGESPQSYYQRLKSTQNNFKQRYYQAMFESGVGIPVNKDAVNEMRNYVDSNVSVDETPMHFSKEFIEQAKRHGVSPEDYFAFLSSKGVF